MKKQLVILAMGLISTSVFASIEIKLNGLKNDHKVFVASVNDGKKIYANNVGSFAIISDSELTQYPASTWFFVGIEGNVTQQYCINSITNPSQFSFNYKTITNSAISLDMQKSGENISVPVCKVLA